MPLIKVKDTRRPDLDYILIESADIDLHFQSRLPEEEPPKPQSDQPDKKTEPSTPEIGAIVEELQVVEELLNLDKPAKTKKPISSPVNPIDNKNKEVPSYDPNLDSKKQQEPS